MKTIDHYIDAAISRTGIKSDRDFCTYLGLSKAAISQYRTKRSWPSPAHMAQIAELAGENPDIALIELNIWKEQDNNARAVYSRILAKLSAAAAPLLLALFFCSAAPTPAHASSLTHNYEYYGVRRRRMAA